MVLDNIWIPYFPETSLQPMKYSSLSLKDTKMLEQVGSTVQLLQFPSSTQISHTQYTKTWFKMCLCLHCPMLAQYCPDILGLYVWTLSRKLKRKNLYKNSTYNSCPRMAWVFHKPCKMEKDEQERNIITVNIRCVNFFFISYKVLTDFHLLVIQNSSFISLLLFLPS